jgi:hypothetical protein
MQDLSRVVGLEYGETAFAVQTVHPLRDLYLGLKLREQLHGPLLSLLAFCDRPTVTNRVLQDELHRAPPYADAPEHERSRCGTPAPGMSSVAGKQIGVKADGASPDGLVCIIASAYCQK